MSGRTLAKVEVMHWCENVLALGWIGLFFVWGNPVSLVVAVVAVLEERLKNMDPEKAAKVRAAFEEKQRQAQENGKAGE